MAFEIVGISLSWIINNEIFENTRGYIIKEGKEINLVTISNDLFRPAEVDSLLANCHLIKSELNWEYKFDFKNLVQKMVENDRKIHITI